MSRQLPVPVRNESGGRSLVVPGQQPSTSSSLARMAISLAPDVLRAAERLIFKQSRQPVSRGEFSQGMHGHSVHLSEVEFDTSIPFVRKVTVRNASSWSTFPIAIQPEPAPRRSRGRLIGVSSAIALVAALMLRRAIPGGRIIDVPGRQRD
jgi:hypothetical protein